MVWRQRGNAMASGAFTRWRRRSCRYGAVALWAASLVAAGADVAAQGPPSAAVSSGTTENVAAGSVQGYNGTVGPPPFNRTELFQAWYAQEMIKDVLKIRIGRVNPGADFNNVLRPVTFTDSNQNIPAVSGLIYSTVFANGTLIG